MKTLKFDFFEIDGVEIRNIGHEMFKTQNQLTYNVSPSRQVDQSMKNINDYNSAVLPKAEFGFKFITAEEYLKLRTIVLSKRVFTIKYYDKDFNNYVTHEMYVEPDNLVAFYSLGNEDIEGIRTFTIQFIATLNEDDLYFAYFVGAKELGTKWGRSVRVPKPNEDYGKNALLSPDTNELFIPVKQGVGAVINNDIKSVKMSIRIISGNETGYLFWKLQLATETKYKLKYNIKQSFDIKSYNISIYPEGDEGNPFLLNAKPNDTFFTGSNQNDVIVKIAISNKNSKNFLASICFYGLSLETNGGGYWQDIENPDVKYYPNDQMNVFKNSNLKWIAE